MPCLALLYFALLCSTAAHFRYFLFLGAAVRCVRSFLQVSAYGSLSPPGLRLLQGDAD